MHCEHFRHASSYPGLLSCNLAGVVGQVSHIFGRLSLSMWCVIQHMAHIILSNNSTRAAEKSITHKSEESYSMVNPPIGFFRFDTSLAHGNTFSKSQQQQTKNDLQLEDMSRILSHEASDW